MGKIILYIFASLSIMALYTTYTGSLGLQEVVSEDKHSIRSWHSGSSSSGSSGWGHGK